VRGVKISLLLVVGGLLLVSLALPQAQPLYRSYLVTNAAAFHALWLPLPAGAAVFWRGQLLDPGPDYSSSAGTFSILAAVPLAAGDRVTVVTWPITTGGSGALDCATIPGVCDVATAVVPLKTSANTWSGANDFSAAAFLRLPSGAGIPQTGCSVAVNAGSAYVRNDAQAPGQSLYVCAQTAPGVYAWELY
jgi:hypothetical protein